MITLIKISLYHNSYKYFMSNIVLNIFYIAGDPLKDALIGKYQLYVIPFTVLRIKINKINRFIIFKVIVSKVISVFLFSFLVKH